MRRLEHKVILLAGAGGIGNGLAERFCAEGARVVVGDMSLDRAEEAAARARHGGGIAEALVLDGADEDSARAAVAHCRGLHGGLDGLHANFASMADCDPGKSVIDLPYAVLDEVYRVNARGYFTCTRAALPALIERGGGSIVYTSSAAAYNSGGGQVAYAMSKAAIHALMRHVARRFGPDAIRANAIAPALTLHPANEALVPEGMIESSLAKAALKARVGRPQDIAAIAALLMAEDGAHITGHVFNVDGGTIIRN